jgi:short-subunit dehydrogenase
VTLLLQTPAAALSRLYRTLRPGVPSPLLGATVLITGASSGIGEELAWQLGRAGAQLTLTARRTALLDALAQRIAAAGSPQPLVVACDVTRDGDVDRAVAESTRRWGKLDVVIANAGFGVVGAFRDLSVDDYRRQFETNVFGVLRTIRAALPALEHAGGNAVILGSVAGWVASPYGSPYAMSKFALRALADAITPELSLSGVTVTLISPGFVASNIRRVDNQGTLHTQTAEPIPPWLVVPTATAVRQILRAVARGKSEAIVTGHGKILVALERFFPWLSRAVKRRIAARGGYRSEARTSTGE